MKGMRNPRWLAVAGMVLLLALGWIGIAMVRPPASQAVTMMEMPAFTFNPVEISSTQTGELCTVNWGDGSINALIGLLDVADTTKAISPVQSVELKSHTSTCVALPAVQRPPTTAAGMIAWTMPFLAVQRSSNWNARQRDLTVSLQVLEGGSSKFAVPGTFQPAVQVPMP